MLEEFEIPLDDDTLQRLQSPFNEVLNNFISALIHSEAATEEAVDHLAGHASGLLDEYIEAAVASNDPTDENRLKALMSVLDLILTGLLFQQYRDYFIQEGEATDDSALDGAVPDGV